MQHKVSLTNEELEHCVLVACRRMRVSRAANRDASRSVDRTWFQHLVQETIGAIGEEGYCKWRGIYPTRDVDVFHDRPDAADGCEIRSIATPTHSLIVRGDDPADRPYVLVYVDQKADCAVLGWIPGVDARRPEYVQNPGGKRAAWFVPQSALRPVEELKHGTHS